MAGASSRNALDGAPIKRVILYNADGTVLTTIATTATFTTVTAADALALTAALKTASLGMVYNGTTYDLARASTVGTGIQQFNQEFTYLNIAAGQATTVVKASAGILHSIVLNSAATATNVTTVYDNASGVGTVLAIPAVTTATVPVTLLFDVKFALGLTIITATANGGNMTVCYR